MSSKPEELTFGNYRILKNDKGNLWELGRGGFGTTYKAEHQHLMRISALKVINAERVTSEEVKKRFLQEARAAASMQHPNIAAIHDFGEEDGVFYYAMEFCSGGDLEGYSEKKGPMSWAQVEPIAIQILGALNHSHQNGMLHRDLKPSNVMLTEEMDPSRLKLIDFGLVKALETHGTSSTQIMLTQDGAAGFNPLTASPEQLREEDLDERSDLFSVGVTLLFLLNGGSPFGEISAVLVMAQRLNEQSYDSLLPDSLQGVGRLILSKLLQKDKENRYRYASEVIDAIQRGDIESSEDKTEAEKVKISDTDVAEVKTSQREASLKRKSLGLGDWDWGRVWSVQGVQQQCAYGSYYLANGSNSTVPEATLFLPNLNSPAIGGIVDYANLLVRAGMVSHVVHFQKAGVLDGETAYLCACPAMHGGRYVQLLQAEGIFTLQDHLSLFQQTAKAVDQAISAGLPGVELEVSMIVVGSHDDSGAPQDESTEDWLAYYRKCLLEDEKFATRAGLTFFPKLEAPQDLNDIGLTLTGNDLASNPLAQFGSLLYRSISGMSVKSAAYLNSSVYVSTSNLGEESNQYLADVIAGNAMVNTAEEILASLCDFEGVAWIENKLHEHLKYQQQETVRFKELLDQIDPSVIVPPAPPAVVDVEVLNTSEPKPESDPVVPPVPDEIKPSKVEVVEPEKTKVDSVTHDRPPAKEEAIQPEPKKKKTKIVVIAAAALVVIGLLLTFLLIPEKKARKSRKISPDKTAIADFEKSPPIKKTEVEAPVKPDPVPLVAKKTKLTFYFNVSQSKIPDSVTWKLYKVSGSDETLISKLKRRGSALVGEADVPVSSHIGADAYLLKVDHPGYMFLGADGESHVSELKFQESDFKFDEARGFMKSRGGNIIKVRPELTFNVNIRSCGRDVDGETAGKLIQAMAGGKYLEGAAKEESWQIHQGEKVNQIKLILPYGASIDQNTKLEVQLPLFKRTYLSLSGRLTALKELDFEPELRDLDLSVLSERLPKFDKVVCEAALDDVGSNLVKKMVGYYQLRNQTVAYEDIHKKIKVLALSGSLRFVGGGMDGMTLSNAIQKEAEKPVVPQFPKAYLYSYVEVPMATRINGIDKPTKTPGFVTVHFDGESELKAYVVYLYHEKWMLFGGKFKVKSYSPEREEWVLESNKNDQRNKFIMRMAWVLKVVGDNEVELNHQEVLPDYGKVKKSDFSAKWKLRAWKNWQAFEKKGLRNSWKLWGGFLQKNSKFKQYPMTFEEYKNFLQGGDGLQ